MGTPDFSVPSLERLAASGHTLAGVITKPDAPRGRGRRLESSPVKLAAERLRIPCWQPESLRDEATRALFASLEPDLIVVVAFRILPPEVLAIPRLGAVNLHASLLPKYRGAAPVQWALINGETRTGVTVFQLEPTVDTGRIIRQREVEIGPDETYGELSTRLSTIGAEELAAAVEDLAEGRAHPLPQDETEATHAPKLVREDGKVHWTHSSRQIRNRVRGTTPAPGAYALLKGEPFGIRRADFADDVRRGKPGEIVVADPKRGVAVATGDGALWLTVVQPPGKRPMEGAAWVRGARPQVGQTFD